MTSTVTKVGQLPSDVDRSTVADLASHNKAGGPADVPKVHTVAPGFIRVLRGDPARPEVMHTPGEALPADVVQALGTQNATTGPDGVILADLR